MFQAVALVANLLVTLVVLFLGGVLVKTVFEDNGLEFDFEERAFFGFVLLVLGLAAAHPIIQIAGNISGN